MVKCLSFLNHFNLQLFGEGGDGGTGDAGAKGVTSGVSDLNNRAKGVNSNPLADVRYGVDTGDAQTADVQPDNVNAEDRQSKFEELIKGEYKDLYDARMQDTVQKRLKASKEIVDKYNALSPMLETLSRKYGVDANDTKALSKAIEEDDSYYEDEALEKGLTVEQLKSIKKIEKENKELLSQIESQNQKEAADRIYADWLNQAEQAKKIYPSLDLMQELANPRFGDLLKSGVDVGSAYLVIHKDEILPAAMQYTAQAVEKKLTDKISANGARPAENGINSQSSVNVKRDVSLLTKADIDEVCKRVARGEKISFG